LTSAEQLSNFRLFIAHFEGVEPQRITMAPVPLYSPKNERGLA